MKWLRRLFHRKKAEDGGDPVAKARGGLPERSGPPAPAGRTAPRRSPPPPPPRRAAANNDPVVEETREPKVALILEDGTSVLPPNDPEWEEELRYYARNVVPGAGKSQDNGPDER